MVLTRWPDDGQNDDGLRGAQTPRLHLVPEYVSSAGRDAIECAALAGLDLDPWQQLVLIGGMGERADGKWAAFEVAEEVPRQNGKGSVLEARELTGMFAIDEERLLIHSAHEQITSSEHFRRMLNLIEGVPEFDRRVQKVVRGKGSEAIELRDGTRIFFKTRTTGGGRGLTGDFVALDEAMILALAVIGVLIPTMAARSILGNPQVWYAGSSVDQEKHEHGIAFARLRARALAGAKSLAYFGWGADVRAWREAHGLPFDENLSEIEQVTPAMLDDPQVWAAANPGTGIRISVEHIALERGALGSREFAVERCGISDPPDLDEDAGRVIAEDVWADCEDVGSKIEGRKVFAVDMSPDRTWASIGVAGKREDGLQHIELVDHERGTGWLLKRDAEGNWSGRLLELHESWPDSWFAIDARGPASGLIQPMRDAGLEVAELSTQDYAHACGGFYDAADQRGIKHIAQEDLDAAVAAARTAPLGEAWKWSRKHSTGADISPLVAVTLARWGDETLDEASAEPLIAWR